MDGRAKEDGLDDSERSFEPDWTVIRLKVDGLKMS